MEPQPRHKIRTLLTLSPSKKPEPWNVLPSGDLSFRKSSLFVFATATRNEAVAARPFDIRLFGLRFKYFECRGCPELSPFGLFLFGRSSRSVFAKINPLQPPAARWPGLPFISNSSSIFGSLRVPKPPNSRTFSPRPEFFQIS